MNKKNIIILALSLVAFWQSSMGQGLKNRFEAKSGWGYIQGYIIGLNYYYTDKLDIGFGVGSYYNTSPFEDEDHFSVQVENTLHFGSETIQHIGGWHFNQQLIYWEQGRYQRTKILSLGLNLGKTIGITPRLGINLEVGPCFNATLDIENYPGEENIIWMWPILPNGSIQLSYKFN